MKKILVLGATGMLGHKVCQILTASGHRVVAAVRGDAGSLQSFGPIFEGVDEICGLDVLVDEDLERVIEEQAPHFVVNAVGLVKQLDQASDPYLAVAVNALLPHRLARACRTCRARLIHISTDCVFDGRRGHYRETDRPDAEDLYGRSKALGETTAVEPAAVTLRTSFIGRELKVPGHGLVEWFLSQEGRRVRGFAGVVYSGLTSRELARVIRRVIEHDGALVGVYQVASQPITKYDLLRLIRSVYGLEIEIDEVHEPRSDRSLVMGPFSELTGYRAPSWETMVRDMHQDPTPYAELVLDAETTQGERKP